MRISSGKSFKNRHFPRSLKVSRNASVSAHLKHPFSSPSPPLSVFHVGESENKLACFYMCKQHTSPQFMLAKSHVRYSNNIPIDHGHKSFFRFFTPVCEADGGQVSFCLKNSCIKAEISRRAASPRFRRKRECPTPREAPCSGVVSQLAPHSYCRRIASANFSPDEAKNTANTLCICEAFCDIWGKIRKQACGKGASC